MAARIAQDEQVEHPPATAARGQQPAGRGRPQQVDDNVMLAQLAKEGWGEHVKAGG